MATFAVVRFEDEGGIEIVSSTWLSDDKKTTKWPSTKSHTKYRECVLLHTTPTDSWKSHLIARIYGFYNEFKDAEERAKEVVQREGSTAEEDYVERSRGTDLTCDAPKVPESLGDAFSGQRNEETEASKSEEQKKRKSKSSSENPRKKSKKDREKSSKQGKKKDHEKSSKGKKNKNRRSDEKSSRSPSLSNLSEDDEEGGDSQSKEISKQNASSPFPPISERSTNSGSTPNQTEPSSRSDTSRIPRTGLESFRPATDHPGVHDEVVFRRMVLLHMSKTEKFMKNMHTAIEAVRQARGCDIVLDDDGGDWAHMLPLDSVEALEKFDKRLTKDENFRNRVVIYLARFATRQIPESIRIIFSQVMTDQVALKYSFQGRGKGKANFSALTLSDVIRRAVRSNVDTSGITIKDMQIEGGKFLTKAGSRIKQRQLAAAGKTGNKEKLLEDDENASSSSEEDTGESSSSGSSSFDESENP